MAETHESNADVERKLLKLTARKTELEIKSLERPAFLRPSGFIPIIVAIIPLLGGLGKLIYENKLQRDRIETGNALTTGLRTAINNENIRVVNVNIKFKGSINRQVMNNLQAALNEQGFVTPRAKRTGETSDVSRITFTENANPDTLVEIKNITNRILLEHNCGIILEDDRLPGSSEDASAYNFTLEISGSCN